MNNEAYNENGEPWEEYNIQDGLEETGLDDFELAQILAQKLAFHNGQILSEMQRYRRAVKGKQRAPQYGQGTAPTPAVAATAHPASASGSRRRDSSLTRSPAQGHPYFSPENTIMAPQQTASRGAPNSDPNSSESSSIPLSFPHTSPSQAVNSIPFYAPALQVQQTVDSSLPFLPAQNIFQEPLQSHNAMQQTPFGVMDNQAGFAVNDSSPSAATNLNQFQSGLHQSGLRGQSTAQDVRYTWQTVSPIPRPTAPIHFPSQSFLLAKASGASSYEPTSSRPNAQGNTGIVEVAASGSATQHTGSTPVGYPAPSNTQVGDIRPSGTTFLLDDSFSLEMFVRAFGVPPPPNRNGGRVIQSGGSTSNANPSVNTGTLAQPSGSSLYPTVLPPCSDPYHAGGAVPNCSVNPSVNAGTWAQPSGSNLFPTGSLPYTNPCHAGGVVPNCNVNPSVNAGTWAQPSGSNLYPTGLLPYTDPCHAGGVVPNCGVNVGTGNTQQSSQIERGPPQLPSFLNELGDGGRGWQL